MDINLQSLKTIVNNVYEEISHLPIVENLPLPRKDSSDECAQSSQEFCSKLATSEHGEDMLFKYKLAVWQTKEVNQEAMRISNIASTRMSRVHQNLNEKYETLVQLQTQLRHLPEIVKQCDQLNKQIFDLQRFFLQTELAFMSLESIDKLVNDQEKIENIPKS